MGLVDSHIHTVFLGWETLFDLAMNEYEGVVTVAYTPFVPRSHDSLADHFEHLLLEKKRLRNLGLRCAVAVGVHPRCVNPRFKKEFARVVEEYLEKADALGEVGLENTEEIEVEILKEQLRVAARLDRPAIIHTPRAGKARALKTLLKILDETGVPEERVVVDHLLPTPEILGLVEKREFMIGVTIQSGKASVEDLFFIVEEKPDLVERIVVNSDAGLDVSNHLAVLDAARELMDEGYVSEAYRMTSLNIKRLLGW